MQTKHKDMNFFLRMPENKEKEKRAKLYCSQLWLLTVMYNENALGMQFSDSVEQSVQ